MLFFETRLNAVHEGLRVFQVNALLSPLDRPVFNNYLIYRYISVSILCAGAGVNDSYEKKDYSTRYQLAII